MSKRTVTNDDLKKYEAMVEKFLKDNIAKNWHEASTRKNHGDIALGNTGYTINDFRQQLKTEVIVAIQNYNPNYKTAEGKSVKESTFVFQHLWNRTGQLMKRLTKRATGYGVYHSNLEETFFEVDRD